MAANAWNPPKGGLVLDDEQRKQLGLKPGEGVRVLSSGVRTVLLERLGECEGTALPWDRDLVLISDVRAFPRTAKRHRRSRILWALHWCRWRISRV